MNNLLLRGNDTNILAKRFMQVLWVTQLAFCVAILVNTLPAIKHWGEGGGLIVLPFLFGIAFCEISKKFVNKGNIELSGKIYLLVMITFSGVVGWSEGGMSSVSVFILPVLGMFAMLFANFKFSLFITFYILTIIIFFGMSNAYDWYAPPVYNVIDHTTRVGGVIGVLLFTVLFGWIFGRDIRKAFSDLDTEHKRMLEAQDVIQKLAETDSLTGLLNRNTAKIKYELMSSELSNDKQKIGFYFIDLDNFKIINDVFDHQEGDRLLKTISDRLKALVKPNDVVCRLGGDEFVIFFKGDETTNFDAFAKNIVSAIGIPYHILGSESEVTASVGVSLISTASLSFDDVRKQADMAMYKAKQLGKNNYAFFSTELHQEYMRNINIVEGLKDALSLNLLDIHFQPKIDLYTNEITGTEALLRWNRGNPNNIQPSEFIPVIESTELIHNIGAWVIQESCRQCKSWHDKGHRIGVACNVSALQLSRTGFVKIVSDALKHSGLEARYLEVEMTEHFLLKDSNGVKGRIKSLKDMGVSIAIDDFGTGYSNMNYLTRLKVDVLKLDQSFISPLGKSDETLVVVKAIIEMARVLNMTVVAEGIESKLQRDRLKALGCNSGQGYLWSKAISSKDFLKKLSDPVIA